jgi:hypothetical protein
MRVVRRSVPGDHPIPGRGQDHPTPGREQAIAPTMDEFGKELRGHRRGALWWSPWGGVESMPQGVPLHF